MAERTFQEMVDYFIDRLRKMSMNDQDKSELVGIVTAMQFRYERDCRSECPHWFPDGKFCNHIGERIINL